MGTLRRGLRAELAAIFDVDPYTLADLNPEPRPPSELTSAHLSTIIYRSLEHVEDARTVYQFLPVIMLRVFGFAAGQGWLETISEFPHRDREALVRLVMPEGPVHRFCVANSQPRDAALLIQSDMRFEFSRTSLPAATDNALRDGAPDTLKKSVRKGQSFLAPFLQSAVRSEKDDVLYLTPLDYFFICMVASPTKKWTQPPGVKRQRRSTSLPSRRALYNQVIAAYAAAVKGTDRVGSNSIFMATCLDYLLVPWAASNATLELPIASASAAEAVLALMLTLVPAHPSELDQVVEYRRGAIPDVIDWKAQTNTSIVYRAAETMLEGVLKNYDPVEYYSPLVVYLRALALFIAPWKGQYRDFLRSALFPKPRADVVPGRPGSSMAAITSRLPSINSLTTPSGSPGNASTAKESQWRMELKARQKSVDVELLSLMILKAVEMKLPKEQDGSRAMAQVADAVVAARVGESSDDGSRDQDVADQLRNSLTALRTYKAEGEARRGRRERNYLTTLACAVGVRLDGDGMLSGFSEMVGMGGVGTVAGVVNMVSGSTSGGALGGRRRLKERRMSALRGGGAADVPFLGDVWDRPIADSENEVVILWLYRLALSLEPRLGFVPNLRFLGRYWSFFIASVVFCSLYLIRAVLKTG